MIGGSLDAQRITVEGPDVVCDYPFTATYIITHNPVWWCQYDIRHAIFNGRGEILSAIGDNGLPLVILGNSPILNGNTIIDFRFSRTATVTVRWEPGCHTVAGIIVDDGGLCRSFEDELTVQVGNTTNQLGDISLRTGAPAIACSTITLCANILPGSENCQLENFEWTIKGENITTDQPCIDYELTSCPLGNVRVSASNACGNETVTRSFECETGPPPPLSFPNEICATGITTPTPGPNNFNLVNVCAPGPIRNIRPLAPTLASINIIHTANSNCFLFAPPSSCIETPNVRFRITFEWCGTIQTRTISIRVRCCENNGGIERSPESTTNKSLLNSEEVSVYPNPVQDYLILENAGSYNEYEIISTDGTLIQNGLIHENRQLINLVPAETKVLILQLKGEKETLTKKLLNLK